MTAPPETPLKIVAIDDEPLALARLDHLVRGIAGTRMVASCDDPGETASLIARWDPDILLLDIEMPGINGMELASTLPRTEGARPFVIFVTAFDHHALGAFDVHAVDYVLKPVTADRLESAIARARTLVRHDQSSRQIQELTRRLDERMNDPDATSDERDRQKIWALRGADFVQLRIGEIERVVSERDYVHIHNAERTFLLRTTLSALHARLGVDRYVRIRRSAIVRLDQIDAIRDRGYGDLRIILRSGAAMRVGRTYLRPLRERFRKGRDPDTPPLPAIRN